MVVPVNAVSVQPASDQAELRMQQEQPKHRRHRRCDRIGPDQQCAVDRAAFDLAVGEHREQQCHRHRQYADHGTEYYGAQDGLDVERIAEQLGEVVEADEDRALAERVGGGQAGPERLHRGPEEEEDRQQELRQDKQRRQQPAVEGGAAFHRLLQILPLPLREGLGRGWA